MARDGLLFPWLGAVHPRFQTPYLAIVTQAIWSAVLVATGTYRSLFTAVVYTEWTFFGLMTGGLFILRRRPDYTPLYRTWGYPVVPIVFVGSTVIIVANQIVAAPVACGLGFLLVAAGLPVYQLWTRAVRRKEAIANASH